MAVPSMNVDVLAKYCKDVNFDFQSCLKVYLKQILLSWEPEFEVKADAVTGDKGERRLQMKKNVYPIWNNFLLFPYYSVSGETDSCKIVTKMSRYLWLD